MKYRLIIILLMLYCLFSMNLRAQQKININVESQFLTSSNKNIQPHYQYSNNWGIIDPFEQTQGLVLGSFKYNITTNKRIELLIGTSGVFKNKTEESFLQESYLNAKFFNLIDLSIGKQAWSPISTHEDLMVGTFMRNANVRPVPRAQIGIFDYKVVPFFNQLFAIKGGLSHGLLNDNRLDGGRSNAARNVQIHEKWVYLKWNKNKYQPYIGLFHAALLGGERANGEKIPVDYWATFFGQPSEKVGGGDATNVAGGHDGFWDFGFSYQNKLGKFQFYIQKPFADRTGLKLYRFRNHDYKIGMFADIFNLKFIKNVSVELFKTNFQAGGGLPDPIDPDGNIIFIKGIKDYDAFMMNTYGIETHGWTDEEFEDYLMENWNRGNRYGERDDYNNNGMYYNGWTYFGQPMGMPLYHTYYLAKAYAQEWEPNNSVIFVNNRVKGFHIGIDGTIFDGFNYLFKSTYSKNYGSYGEEYIRRYSWEKDPEFYYRGGKSQWYSNLSLSYHNKNLENLNLKTSISYDSGDLYDAFGIMFGIVVQVK
ncbi:hypothetical protein [Plebeiibacterium sediminum]|uniref:Capsule assembly protein Wzi n=1 Tax=Plebeiibacterium sediminum TaxID=2992112 RepID=A0AAE3SEU1_9BACT|nr:hypothetical protein [Plebeiobacterium sediminum]MCW3786750.1 hypothetical protein [Plebeiobacterium sediminum]